MVTELVCGSKTDNFKIFNSYASFRKIESFKNERRKKATVKVLYEAN